MCGVLGVYRRSVHVANDIITGQTRLQHRGQESAGIAIVSGSGDEMLWHRGLGLVSHVSREGRWETLPGRMGIGHNRYSTKGSTTIENAGPIKVPSPIGPIAVSYNGNLVNANQLRLYLSTKGLNFETTSDTEVIAQCIVYYLQKGCPIVEALAKMMNDLLGAYSLTVLTLTGLYAVRDPHGIRPLCLGSWDDGYIISSETCGLLDASFIREIERGEIVAITNAGLSFQIVEQKQPAFCIFEFIYVGRPDSSFLGANVSCFRERSGQELACEEKDEGFQASSGSITIPMPNTALPAGVAWGWEMAIPPEFGCIKDRYNPERTFIMPEQRARVSGVNAFTIIENIVRGKIVYMVDDSIVRGTTKWGIVKRLFDAGAREVHGRITSPPYRFPCFYGIDTAEPRELVAASRGTEEVGKTIGLDSLRHLSVEGLYRAILLPQELFCDACFTGDYPIDPLDESVLAKDSLER